MEKTLKRTPLYEEHLKLGARLGEFAGYEMPLWYEGIQKETLAVRTAVGLFDVSHMGKILIWGPGALEFLQEILTANLKKLKNGRAVYSLVCKGNGGIIDDLILCKTSHIFLGNVYLLIVNASNIEKVLNHLRSRKSKNELDAIIEDGTDNAAMLAIQGPRAENILKKLGGVPLNLIPEERNDFCTMKWQGFSLLISRTGYTGEDGFEIIVENSRAGFFWQKLLETGKDLGLKPCGLAARDVLRLEAGLPLYGHELTKTINPLEAGLEKFVKMRKKGNFAGKLALKYQKKQGARKKLIGLEVLSGRIARNGYSILKNGEVCGWTTSGAFSPTLKKSIGMGYIASEFSDVGSDIEIDILGMKHPAKIVKLPFYRR